MLLLIKSFSIYLGAFSYSDYRKFHKFYQDRKQTNTLLSHIFPQLNTHDQSYFSYMFPDTFPFPPFKRPHNQLSEERKEEATSDSSHLSSLIHFDNHGTHYVVSITNKSTTITVTPALAAHALFPLQHHLKIRQKVHTKQQHKIK